MNREVPEPSLSRAGPKLPVLTAEGVTAGYRAGSPVLHDICLGLERGKILAVIGPNGAGKTTLFNCITGMERPWEGDILFGPSTESVLSSSKG